jgi:hypothetical protein
VTRWPSPGWREVLNRGRKGLGSRELVGTLRLWLLASEGIGPRTPNCQPLLPGAIPYGSALTLVGVSLDGRKSYVVGPLGPLLESYSIVRSLTGRYETS